MTDYEDQNDELCALESIYTPEELQIEKDQDGKISGTFFAFVSVPKGFHITYKVMDVDSPMENPPINAINLSYLPPITLTFKLPLNYPSECMPHYHISCPYLNFGRLKLLARKLEKLWKENNGIVILYIWTQFLKEESLSFLKIGEKLDVTGFYVNKLPKKKNVPIPDNYRRKVKNKRTTHMINDIVLAMKVSVTPIPNMHLHEYLKAYSDEQKKTLFLKGTYMCEICFTEKIGTNCIQFTPCDHVYCKDCMKSFFEVRIMEGSIHSMPCPHEKCNSEALQSQIRDCVGSTLYSKYDRQLLTATLEKMQDITYCPRSVCGCPVMRENDEKMAVCPSCQHVFCVFCKMTYHGVEPCRMKKEEKLKIIQEYEEGDESVKLMLEKRYGKKQIAVFMADAKSESWISSNSKPCPKCNVAIEKSDGCNKMSCFKCHTYFCWLCLAILDATFPYFHYNDPTSRCHAQLFEGTIERMVFLDEEEDFDELDEEEEEFEEEHYEDYEDDLDYDSM